MKAGKDMICKPRVHWATYNIQDLKIAQQLISRVRCNLRAGGQRKTLDTAQKMIAEVLNELIEYGDEE